MEQPQKIGRYIIQQLLGEGAMGSVFKAVDPAIKRTVAIKTIKIDKSRSQEEQEEFLQRFFQEAQISGNLNHPNIVSIYDIGDENGTPYLALEYVEGKTLNQLVRGSIRPGFESLVKAIVQVANALTFAHRKGIVHRDLKPANIMITPEGEAKIMDFGIAKMSGSNLTQTGIFLGTPSYSSPEQVREGRVDHRSDIFSLGILAHEILTGFNPFPGQNISTILYKIANEPPVPPANLGELPVNQDKWVETFNQVLEKDPNQRIQNASQFGQMLINCMQFSATTTSELAMFVDDQPPTVRQTIGVDKHIQRSDFESKALSQPSVAVKAQPRRTGLWVSLMLIVFACAYLGLDAGRVLPENARVSKFFPESIRTKFFPPTQVKIDLEILSTPEAAEVYLDGRKLGVTPMKYELVGQPKAQFRFSIQKEGFESFDQDIVCERNDNQSISAELMPLPLKATIQSQPRGATVVINEKQVGKTPLQFNFKKGSTYEVGFKLGGYESETVTFNPDSDPVEKLNLSLKKFAPPGTLSIASSFKDLSVTVDGRAYRPNMKLKQGSYRLRMRSKTYYYDQTISVRIKSDEVTRVSTPPVVTISKIDFKTGGKWAILHIDGTKVDYTPIGNLDIAQGQHTFNFYDESGTLVYQEKKEVVDGSEVIVPL